MDPDIISLLPVETKEKILSKLPIKDAVRTSILSTTWRYTWASMPYIVIEDDDLAPDDRSFSKLQFVKNVDSLLFNHKGSILTTKYLCPKAFDRWILNLSRNGITQFILVLNLASTSKYTILLTFFLCDALQYVDLSRCSVKLPQGFEGFKLLRTLKLERCTISAADLERLVSSSPNLVHLVLKFFQVRDDIRIFSKGLECLMVFGDFLSDIQIDAPNLTLLFIGRFKIQTSSTRVKCINKLCQSLGGLINIQQIILRGFSVQNIVERSPAVIQNSYFQKLSYVALDVHLADERESYFALSLLQNAVNLQELKLTVMKTDNTISSSFWEQDIVFKSLQTVHIVKFEAAEPVLAFVKFILSSSPILEKLTLEEHPTGSVEENPKVLKRLLKFRRASAKAEVVFE